MLIVYNELVSRQTDQKIKNLPVPKAGELSGSDPDYSNRDLYNAIATGNHVSTKRMLSFITYLDYL